MYENAVGFAYVCIGQMSGPFFPFVPRSVRRSVSRFWCNDDEDVEVRKNESTWALQCVGLYGSRFVDLIRFRYFDLLIRIGNKRIGVILRVHFGMWMELERF